MLENRGLVLLSCFWADEYWVSAYNVPDYRAEAQGMQIGTLLELFNAKSLVLAVRSKTRDWLDLYLLMRDHGFDLNDYRQAFIEAGPDPWARGEQTTWTREQLRPAIADRRLSARG